MNEPSPPIAEPAVARKTEAAACAASRPFEGPRGYERFRDEAVIPQLFEVSTDPARFHGRLTSSPIGDATLTVYDMAACGYERTLARARRDGVDHVWIQLVEQGGLSASSRDRSVELRPGSAALCDFGVQTRQASLASQGVVLMMPRAAFAHLDVSTLHGATAHGARFALLRDHLAWLRATLDRATPAERDRATRSLAEVTVACLTSASRPSDMAGEALGATTLRRARTYMTANLGRPDLHWTEIARAVGVSRSTLYRLCAPEGGVAEMLWLVRLEAARAALSDPTMPGLIGDIASACGFTSSQHFSRRFRDRYGFSPRNLRPF